jgi:hypothetical protein
VELAQATSLVVLAAEVDITVEVQPVAVWQPVVALVM